MNYNLSHEELIKVFEGLVESGMPLFSHRCFREGLDRDQNLAANQMIREANGNIAYRSVDFDLNGKTDAEIWAAIEQTPYLDVIEENAAVGLMKMAEKLKILK